MERWTQRISRAEELTAAHEAVASLLDFYRAILKWQSDLDRRLRAGDARPFGSLADDLERVESAVPELLGIVEARAPLPLATEARQLLDNPANLVSVLLGWWRDPSDRQFIPKACLQPYAQWLVDIGVSITDRPQAGVAGRCPRCGGAPQLSILRGVGTAGDGGRFLLCATCLTPSPFRRVLCASCGEEDERKLGYYYSPSLDHVRVDVCETCRRYLKTIDLARLGTAVPLVDEVAAAALDVWARERGYEKIELNLLGL